MSKSITNDSLVHSMWPNLGVTLFELRTFRAHIIWFEEHGQLLINETTLHLHLKFYKQSFNLWMGSALPFIKVFPNLNTQVHGSFFQPLGTDPFLLLMMCNCQKWWVIPMWGCAFCLHLSSWRTQGDNIILRPYFPWLANQWCCQKPGATDRPLSTLPSEEM